MRQVRTVPLSEVLELQSFLESQWPERRAALRASGVPLNESETEEEKTAREAAEAAAAAKATADAAAAAAEAAKKKPWGDDNNFDPDRAWKLIENTREDARKAKAEADALRVKVKEHEDADKSEADKLAERTSEAEKAASAATLEASRLRVALSKGLTESQAKRLIGNTQEELEADADELLASFKTEDDDGQDPTRRPRERLRPGAAPSSEVEETDPAKLAELVPRV